jgi:hypothetical protein
MNHEPHDHAPADQSARLPFGLMAAACVGVTVAAEVALFLLT